MTLCYIIFLKHSVPELLYVQLALDFSTKDEQ